MAKETHLLYKDSSYFSHSLDKLVLQMLFVLLCSCNTSLLLNTSKTQPHTGILPKRCSGRGTVFSLLVLWFYGLCVVCWQQCCEMKKTIFREINNNASIAPMDSSILLKIKSDIIAILSPIYSSIMNVQIKIQLIVGQKGLRRLLGSTILQSEHTKIILQLAK